MCYNQVFFCDSTSNVHAAYSAFYIVLPTSTVVWDSGHDNTVVSLVAQFNPLEVGLEVQPHSPQNVTND